MCQSIVYLDYDNPDLILMDMSTYLDASVDADYHARTSRGIGIQPLRRKSKEPCDYKDHVHNGNPFQLPPMETAKPTLAKAAFAKAVSKARNLRRSTRGSTKARQHLSMGDAAILRGELCSCELRLVDPIDMDNYTKFVDGASELKLKENYGGLLSDKDLFQNKEPNGYTHRPSTRPSESGSGSDLKGGLFPTWVPLSEDPAHQPVTKDLRCYVTEVQLQAILDSQGDGSKRGNQPRHDERPIW